MRKREGMIFADMIVDISHEKLDRSFQYLVPQELEEQIGVGMVAEIPFGKGNHIRKGYVIGLSDRPAYETGKMKSIIRLLNGEETTESRLIALAAWMRERYGATMIQALKTVIPVKEAVKAKEKKTDPSYRFQGRGRCPLIPAGNRQMQGQGPAFAGAPFRGGNWIIPKRPRNWVQRRMYGNR